MNKATDFQYRAIQIMQEGVQELSIIEAQISQLKKDLSVLVGSVKSGSERLGREIIDQHAFNLLTDHNDDKALEYKVRMYVKLHNDLTEFFDNFKEEVKYMFNLV